MTILPSIPLQVSAAEIEDEYIQMPEEWGVTPKGGGTLIWRVYREPTHFNPNYEYLVGDECYQNVYDKLILHDVNGFGIIPCLADSWLISSDYLTYTFYLNEDAKWHDGVKFTADDVKFTFDDVKAKDGYYWGSIDHIDEIEIVDDYTVVFHLSKPDSALLYTMSHYTAPVILPKHLYEGTDVYNNPHNFNPIGTGPFKFVEWVKGSHIKYEANLDYYRGRPYLDTIIHKLIVDHSAFGLSLKTGEAHVGYYSPPLSMHPELEADPNLVVDATFASNLIWYGFNLHNEPFDDLRVRKAISHCIDVPAFIDKIWYGYYWPNPYAYGEKGFLPWSFNPNAKMPEYDVDEANRLLDDAGLARDSDGVRFRCKLVTFTSMEAPTMAEVLKQYLKPVGIECDIEVYEFVTFKEVAIVNRQYDIACNGGNQGPDPSIWKEFLHSEGFRNLMYYDNPEVDQLFEDGATSITIPDRQKAYWKIQEIVAEELPRVTIAVYGTTFPHHKDYNGFHFQEPYSELAGFRRSEYVYWAGGEDITKTVEPPTPSDLESRVDSLESSVKSLSSDISDLESQITSLEGQIKEPAAAPNTMAYLAIAIAVIAIVIAFYFGTKQ
jgi:peptide/nickel transport system substrate-binding protein